MTAIGDRRPVLLYDGECGLCNRIVRMLLNLDKRGRLHYAALQSETAQRYLKMHNLPRDFSTLVFVPDWNHQEQGGARIRSSGVVAALHTCGGWGAVLGVCLWLVPLPIRNRGYALVSRWRMKLFGPPDACALPKSEWRERFIS